MEHCRWLVGQQTLQPDEHIVVDYPPPSEASDYYDRALFGLEQAMSTGIRTLAMFMEDDDYYRNDYIKTMYTKWKELGEPVICGAHGRYNYNILSRRYTLPKRLNYVPGFGSASLGETAVSEIPQPLVRRKCLDIPMWVAAKTKAMFVNHDFFTAIKHGTGLRDTFEHSYTLTHGEQDDESMSWLRKRVDPYSFEFYQGMSRG